MKIKKKQPSLWKNEEGAASKIKIGAKGKDGGQKEMTALRAPT